MAILTPPSSFCGPLSTQMMLAPLATSSPVSSFNRRSIVDGPISEFWRAQVVLAPRKGGTYADPGWRDTAAFLMSLRGGANLARIYDPRRYPMRGAGGPFSTISLAANAVVGATTITVRGLTPNTAQALMADDHLGIGENLHTVINHAGSDNNGEATISILPPLRMAVAENDSINLVKPTAVMMLVGGYQDLSVLHTGRADPLVLEFFEQPEFNI